MQLLTLLKGRQKPLPPLGEKAFRVPTLFRNRHRCKAASFSHRVTPVNPPPWCGEPHPPCCRAPPVACTLDR